MIDAGTLYTRAGFAGERGPRATFPTVVARAKVQGALEGGRDVAVGAAALAQSAIASLKVPVAPGGRVTAWDGMTSIWRHAFYGPLGASPDEHSVLLLDAGLPGDRERALQVRAAALGAKVQ